MVNIMTHDMLPPSFEMGDGQFTCLIWLVMTGKARFSCIISLSLPVAKIEAYIHGKSNGMALYASMPYLSAAGGRKI